MFRQDRFRFNVPFDRLNLVGLVSGLHKPQPLTGLAMSERADFFQTRCSLADYIFNRRLGKYHVVPSLLGIKNILGP